MAGIRTEVTRTDTGREPTGRRRASWVATAAFLVPGVAWILDLALTWAVQEMGCAAAASADAPDPGTSIFAVLMVLNAALFVVIVLAGVSGLVVARRNQGEPGTGLLRFLGYGGAVLALLFGLGLVMVAVNPLYLEICA